MAVDCGGFDVTCTQCHGSADNPAPPRSTDDASDTSEVTVGAHQAHLRDGTIRAAIPCGECHIVPATVNQEGHLDYFPAEVIWGTLATTSDASPQWDRAAASCTDTYCHGATLGGGSNKVPQWTAVDGSQAACGTCHGVPPPPPHPQNPDCQSCHPQTMDGAGGIDVAGGMHINGVVEVGLMTCSSCHGSPDNNAPPQSTEGDSATSNVGVGAHQSHLRDGSIRQAIACEQCHVVPTSIEAPGHLDTPLPAELTWGDLATTADASPTWDSAGATCAETYCHGATLSGGTNKTPDWTVIDGSQAACGTCHGAPPPWPHPSSGDCASCHPQTMDGSAIDVAGGFHINGVVEVTGLSCNACHGSGANPAPPADTTGQSASTEVTVGAHQSHLTDGVLRRAISCSECHVVPQSQSDAGHIDPSPAELTWGTLATTEGATPLWDRSITTCSYSYCHGATLGGGSNKTPDWTVVDGSQTTCGSCHGVPPPPPHPASGACYDCHPDTVDQSFQINPDTHIDGILQVRVTGQCTACHGAPPATGSHLIHYGGASADVSYGGTGTTGDLLPGGGAYAFDCGNCHPLDPTHHRNGVLNAGGGQAEIDLSPAGAPPTSLKARNATTASYTPGPSVNTDGNGFTYTLGSCDGVYCHSSKQVETPAGVPEPGLDFVFAGYPLVYPAFTLDATRSYSVPTWGASLSCDGCHGFPPRTESPLVVAGAGNSHSFIDADGFEDLHGYNHGGDPIPCATCHFDTVTDPGVRWRDYAAPANGWSVYEPVPIAGHPEHVNGQSDVAFTTASATVISTGFDLTGASWDAASGSCDNVGCHLLQTPATWGTPYRYNNVYECNVCHQM